MDEIQVCRVDSPAALRQCFAIREEVFVRGQKVPYEEEMDGRDDSCTHYLLRYQGRPAATARTLQAEGYVKIQRVCVVPTLHGKGLGAALMQHILQDIAPVAGQARLGAQMPVIPFYEKLGFTVCSEVYMDAGIPHKEMVCTW